MIAVGISTASPYLRAGGEKTHYPSVIAEIKQELPEWWSAGESTVAFFADAILDLETRLERREALDSIPKDTPHSLRKFVRTASWRSGKRVSDVCGRSCYR